MSTIRALTPTRFVYCVMPVRCRVSRDGSESSLSVGDVGGGVQGPFVTSRGSSFWLSLREGVRWGGASGFSGHRVLGAPGSVRQVRRLQGVGNLILQQSVLLTHVLQEAVPETRQAGHYRAAVCPHLQPRITTLPSP